MDFIDYFQISQKAQNDLGRPVCQDFLGKIFKKISIFNNLKLFVQINSPELTSFKLKLANEVDFEIHLNIEIDLRNLSLKINFLISHNKLFQAQNIKNKKILGLRAFLRLNMQKQKVKWILNPITGNIQLKFHEQIAEENLFSENFWTDLINFVIIQKNDIIITYEKLLIKYQTQHPQFSDSLFLKTQKQNTLKKELLFFKKINNSSPFYTLNKSSFSTRKIGVQDKQNLKRKYLGEINFKKVNPFISKMMKSSTKEKIFIEPLFPFLKSDDQEFQETLCKKHTSIITTEKIFTVLKPPIQKIKEIIGLSKKSATIATPDGDQTKLLTIHTFSTPKQIQKIHHEAKILLKLANRVHSAFLNYYFIKSQQKAQTEIYLTNLGRFQFYHKYLMMNSATISLHTKLYLLSQVINALTFLRNHSIIFHNLHPQNIIIKKGLVIKIKDFSNAYQLDITNHQPKSKYPYVSPKNFDLKKPQEYQKSDMYSFGILMYQTLLSQELLKIKNSTYTYLSENEKIKKINGNLLGMEKLSDLDHELTRILLHFSMECIQFDQQEECQQDEDENEKNSRFSKRPYLDWCELLLDRSAYILAEYF